FGSREFLIFRKNSGNFFVEALRNRSIHGAIGEVLSERLTVLDRHPSATRDSQHLARGRAPSDHGDARCNHRRGVISERHGELTTRWSAHSRPCSGLRTPALVTSDGRSSSGCGSELGRRSSALWTSTLSASPRGCWLNNGTKKVKTDPKPGRLSTTSRP